MTILDELLRRRVLFVTGKGGVGKSTIAAALALIGRTRGLRVLLVDVEAKGDAARFLDGGPTAYRAREAMPGLSHLGIQPEDALEEYLRRAIRLPRLYRVGPVGRIFDFIATAAPGVAEVLIAGKIWYEERAKEGGRPTWDLIVVDAAPSGQVLSHIRGPRTLLELVSTGLIRQQSDAVREVLEDPQRTAIVVTTLLEEMPVAETEELVTAAPAQVDTPVLALVVNRVLAAPPDGAAADALLSAGEAIGRVLGADVRPAVAAATLTRLMAHNQGPHRRRLAKLGLPMVEIPSMAIDRHGLQTTRAVARALEDGAK